MKTHGDELTPSTYRDALKPLEHARKFTEADILLQTLAQLHPDLTWLRKEIAHAYKRFSKERPDRSESYLRHSFEHFATASKLCPHAYIHAYHAGHVGRLLMDPATPLYLGKAIKIEPENAIPWFELGLYAKGRTFRKTAASCFRNAVRLDPINRGAKRELRGLTGIERVTGTLEYAPFRRFGIRVPA